MRTEEAKRTLRKVAKHMRESMTPAAQVRRDFTSGRPAKAASLEPMHPDVVWQRAHSLLSDLRGRMTAAGLDPKHAEALLVYVNEAKPFEPMHLLIEPESKRAEAFDVFIRGDVRPLGLAFRQYDEQAGKNVFFVRQLSALTDQGIAVLRLGAALLKMATDKGEN
jgi:hypothetical protein